jgi:hypothetical protein
MKTEEFQDICKRIVEDEELFRTFRSNPEYVEMHEIIPKALSKKYYGIVRTENPDLLREEFIYQYRQNDSVGKPLIYPFDIGPFSPTIFRYIKVMSDLKILFNSLDNMNIIEIGGGCGGQCNIISKLYKYKSYTLIDLPEVMELQKKYLNVLKTPNVRFKIDNRLKYDLVISNYAFSELDRDIQDGYIENILLKSKRGYMTMNREHVLHFKKELFEILKIKKPRAISENPLTSPENYIVIWGENEI